MAKNKKQKKTEIVETNITDQDTGTTQLNEKLLDQFTNRLEFTINQVCEDNPGMDPRLELAVTLGLFAAQVSIDSGFNKQEFLNLMSDMFDDTVSNEGEKTHEEPEPIDKSQFN